MEGGEDNQIENNMVYCVGLITKDKKKVVGLTDTNVVTNSNAKTKRNNSIKGDVYDLEQHTPTGRQRGKSNTNYIGGYISYLTRRTTSIQKDNSITSPLENLGGGLGNLGGDGDDNNPQ